MSTPAGLPVVGAAASLDDIENVAGLRDFLLDRQRDIELRDLVEIGALQDGAWRAIAERAARLLDGHTGRVGIHGPFWGLAIDTPDPDVRKIVAQRLDAGLDACIAITRGHGNGHMVVHSPFTTWHSFNRGTFYDDSALILDMTHRCLGPAVRKAEDNGIVIVIENCEDRDPAERVALARSFASPAVQVSVDTGHAHYAHVTTGAPPVDVFVRTAGADLAHVHLQDADGVADRHWAIGQGNILWPSVFTALSELPTMPRLLLEMADGRSILPSAAWLAERKLAQ